MKHTLFILSVAGTLLLSSCTMTHKTLREPNARVEFEAEDFEFSDQVTASATSTRIFGIDFSRLFSVETGGIEHDGSAVVPVPIDIASIPVIGTYVMDPTSTYALYNLMKDNPGYDVVFYPSFTTKTEAPIGIPIFTKTTVDVQARLAKIK